MDLGHLALLNDGANSQQTANLQHACVYLYGVRVTESYVFVLVMRCRNVANKRRTQYL